MSLPELPDVATCTHVGPDGRDCDRRATFRIVSESVPGVLQYACGPVHAADLAAGIPDPVWWRARR